MLGIFSNKSDHPLANIKSAKQLLDELPKKDAVEVLQEIGLWIETLFDPDNGYRLDHQYAVMILFDEAAHPYLKKNSNSYFAAVPPSAFQETRLWGAMHAYYAVCEKGYLHLLKGLINGDKGSATLKPGIALIIARGIHAIYRRLECVNLKYAQLYPACWTNLADFYDYAEQTACVDEALQVYAGGESNNSIRSLFASVLSWYSIAAGAFKPQELHIARCLISHVSRAFVVHPQIQVGSLFVFDLAHPAAPMRVIVAGASYPLSARFINMVTPAGYIDNVLKTLGKNIVPPELRIEAGYSAEIVTEVVKRLAVYFHEGLSVRRTQRRKIQMNVNVVSGFLQVLAQTEAGLNLEGIAGEACAVEDLSADGMCFVLSAELVNRVQIGSLVGLQLGGVGHWSAAIVRRMRRDNKNNMHVGVKFMANKIASVVLYNNDESKAGTLVLMPDNSKEQGGDSVLLMQPDTFFSYQRPRIDLDGQCCNLSQLVLVEKGVDFDTVRYWKATQDDSSDE